MSRATRLAPPSIAVLAGVLAFGACASHDDASQTKITITITAAPESDVTTTSGLTSTTIVATTTTFLDLTQTSPLVTFPPATVPLPTQPAPPTTTTTPASSTTIPAGATGRYLTDPTANVNLGDWGPAVALIQRQLIIWQFGPGIAIDNVYDATTKADLAAFQRANGLSADGICGHNTWAILGGTPPPSTEPKPATP